MKKVKFSASVLFVGGALLFTTGSAFADSNCKSDADQRYNFCLQKYEGDSEAMETCEQTYRTAKSSCEKSGY